MQSQPEATYGYVQTDVQYIETFCGEYHLLIDAF